MATRQVVVTGDCLRPNPNGSFGGINELTRWLTALVDRQVRRATGVAPTPLLLDAVAGIDAVGFYDAIAAPDPVAGWAGIYDTHQHLPAIAALYEPHVRDAVVIGFELPLYLQRALDRLGVPYVDLWVHPVRFLDDLMIACRATGPAQAAVRAHAIDEEVVWLTAGLRKASMNRYPPAVLKPDSTLVLGQSWSDKSQVVDGRFVDAEHYRDRVAGVACGGEWLLKPHPHAAEHSLLRLVSGLDGARARVVRDNVYFLLAQDAVARVLTFNSSAGTEAYYFGKECHMLLPRPIPIGYRGDPPADATYWSLADSFLNTDFWRDVLGCWVPTTPKDGYAHPPKANRLRTSLRAFWDFNQIDTDVAAGVARPFHPETLAPVAPTLAAERPVDLLPAMSVLAGGVRDYRGVYLSATRPRGPAARVTFALPAGTYRARVACVFRGGHDPAGPAVGVDVVLSYGATVVREKVVLPAGGGGFDFQLAAGTDSAEVRLWNEGNGNTVVTGVVVEPVGG